MKLAISSIDTLGHRSTENWFHVKNGKADLPFKFKDQHPSNFAPIDFAIWAAFYPHKARLHFNSVLMDAFEYSWTVLTHQTGEKPSCPLLEFVDSIDDWPWLRQEFTLWGGLLSYLWVSPPQTVEPKIFKLIPHYFRNWKICQRWFCDDGISPRVFTFAELAFQERSLFILDEEVDYLEKEEALLIDVKCPNLGTQFLEDSASLMLLLDGYGFDDKGVLSYRANHNRLIK